MKATLDIVKILAAGGGITMDAKAKSFTDLVKLAATAKSSGATLILRNVGLKATNDLVRIGQAGGGKVICEI